MNERDFCYWLQGFFEVSASEKLTEEQVLIIKEHLQLVFYKKTTGDKKVLPLDFRGIANSDGINGVSC
jgi:hypothetical protein